MAELPLESALAQMLLLSFEGRQATPEMLAAITRRPIGGLVLFRHLNAGAPAGVRALTAALQAAAAASGQPPLIIAADQEGGQLIAMAEGTTPFPGNLALGATGSDELAYRVGLATGRELAALGINVDFAPVVDVNINPRNPVVGTRSFGEDPALVSRLGAAMVKGLQAAGVAATAKHFPGHGDTASDSHHGVPLLAHDAERLRRVELPPFKAAIAADAKLVLSAHVGLPALNGGLDLPATLSQAVLKDLLRGELGFEGVIVTDAMDMHAIAQDAGLPLDCLAAARAGADLLLLASHTQRAEEIYALLLQAARRGLLPHEEIMASAGRVRSLREWIAAQAQPSLDVAGCAEHRDLAYEVAARSVTLVRDRDGILPLHLKPGERLMVAVPKPRDLTPADTSSYQTPELAAALRRLGGEVDEFIYSLDAPAEEVAALRARAEDYAALVVGTINAGDYPGQAALVQALLESGKPLVAVALRMPYDLGAYPNAPAYACTYSIQPPAMLALADALLGRVPFRGKLPVTVTGGEG